MKKKQGFWRTVWEAFIEATCDVVDPRRVCQKCGGPILKNHRWHQVRRKRWGKVKTWVEHRNCEQPTENPVTYSSGTKRLPGEVPLPFPAQIEQDVLTHRKVAHDS